MAGFAQETPILQGTHPPEVIRQGLVAGRQAPRRIVLRVLPAQRPLSQPLRELEVESGLNIRRRLVPVGAMSWPSVRPLVQDGPIDPARDHGPLAGRRVHDRIRRVAPS